MVSGLVFLTFLQVEQGFADNFKFQLM